MQHKGGHAHLEVLFAKQQACRQQQRVGALVSDGAPAQQGHLLRSSSAPCQTCSALDRPMASEKAMVIAYQSSRRGKKPTGASWLERHTVCVKARLLHGTITSASNSSTPTACQARTTMSVSYDFGGSLPRLSYLRYYTSQFRTAVPKQNCRQFQ